MRVCVRACVRAKLRERVRDDVFPSLVTILGSFPPVPPGILVFAPAVSVDSLQGFKENVSFWHDSLQGCMSTFAILADSLQGFKASVSRFD